MTELTAGAMSYDEKSEYLATHYAPGTVLRHKANGERVVVTGYNAFFFEVHVAFGPGRGAVCTPAELDEETAPK